MLHAFKSTPDELMKRLPPRTRAKVQTFTDAASAEHGAVNRLTERELEANDALQAARREKARQLDGFAQIARRPDAETLAGFDAAVSEAETERDRLRDVRRKASERYQAAKAIETAIFDWLPSIAGSLREAKAPSIPKGASVDSIRAEIDTIESDIDRTHLAPAPAGAVKSLIEASLDAIAAKGAPSIDPRIRSGDPAKLDSKFQLTRLGDNMIGDSGASFFVWLLRDTIRDRLFAMVGPDAPDALTDRERERLLADLTARKLEMERVEEALIEQAHAEGRAIARRPDADPRAILGVEVIGGR